MGTTQVQTIVEPSRRRVVRYKRDQVGNDLTAVLRWCTTHQEPLWEFGDGSWECPHARVVGWDSEPHEIVDGPWEVAS